ncbi:Uncharacterized protein Adt_12005 [Abeliophyllum distichum]|uniref:Uncharacterized protein n=1 Tax=Abeliophyllum distichum TaxID=126358 RepID=A0ABD1UPI9_9LAMI
MPNRVRWNSMPRGPRLQDEDDNDWSENGFETDTEASPSAEDNEGSDGRKRGPNLGTNGRADECGRTPLIVGDNRFITPSASRAVSANLKAYLGGPYPTFSLVPNDTKKLLWERFEQQYSWPKHKDNEVVKAWNTASTDRLRDIFCVARKKANESSGSDNTKSKSGRDNRLTLKSGTITKHTGGSITIAAHKLKLHEKLGKSPTASQLFECVHRRKKGEGNFVDNKSRIVYEKYNLSIDEKYGLDMSTQPKFDIHAWCEATEGLEENASFITLQEEFRSACNKIDDLTRENNELLQKMEDGRREEVKKRIEFEQTILRMLGERNRSDD